MRQQIKFFITIICIFFVNLALAQLPSSGPTDRVQLATEQLALLTSRLEQTKLELKQMEEQHDKEYNVTIDKINKNIFEKANLDLSVSSSNLDTINIELSDCQQTISWLEKSITENDNQLNAVNIFGLKGYKSDFINTKQLRNEIQAQQSLLVLEKARASLLQELRDTANKLLTYQKDNYEHLDKLIKAKNLMNIKQQQIKAELSYQEQQNEWLQQINSLNAKLAGIDPNQNREIYSQVERGIFYASENANYAYVQSLLARYKDQVQQMKLSIMNSNSISLLNEISDQLQTINKQIGKLDTMINARMDILHSHIAYLTKRKNDAQINDYINKLAALSSQYKTVDESLVSVNKNLQNVRINLDKALQKELSSRQGFPTFDYKSLVDLGKEIFYLPALTFKMFQNVGGNLYKGFIATSALGWYIFAIAEILFVASCIYLRKCLVNLISHPDRIHDQMRLSLHWLKRSFIDIALLANVVGIFMYFDVPQQNYNFIIYLTLVWIAFKSMMVIARLSLIESTHDTSGHDVRLYARLKWVFIFGGIITALTVFAHQIPLIYELRTLCDRLFLLLLMAASILLLRSSDVVPNLILMHTETQHPYLQKSIRLICTLVPILMFGNAVIGLFGFVNLIMTVSWYEGIFLFVLVGYLILRNLLSDAMEYLSRLMIQYFNNGWLWTEAFLKPIDNILRITLFLFTGAFLFLLYGWDKQSPIVERLTRLLHYKLIYVLNTTITPLNIIELCVVISIFYWTAKWTREFIFRLLLSRTKDMGIRNSIAILSQYTVVIIGVFMCLRVLGINLQALAFVAGMLAFGIGLGLRDLANNFACGFLILLERPLRVGDIVNIAGYEGEVKHIGSRAVTVRTWDHMELVVPNTEIFNKLFTNWTAKDTIIRSVVQIKTLRHDNPHEIKSLIQSVLAEHNDVLKEPMPEVYLKSMNDALMEFEIRYYVNIRLVASRTSVVSAVLMKIWDTFAAHGIKPPYPQHEIFLTNKPGLELLQTQ